jgi:hypothetical protein
VRPAVRRCTVLPVGWKPPCDAREAKGGRGGARKERVNRRDSLLAGHVEVKGARFENGPLVIDLQREIREAMKPPHPDPRRRWLLDPEPRHIERRQEQAMRWQFAFR